MQKFVKFLVIVSLISGFAFSQSEGGEPKYWIGGSIFYSVGMNEASFSQLPGSPNCCLEFNSTIGSGMGLSGIFYYPITSDLYLDTRLTFLTSSTNFTEENAKIGNQLVRDGSGVRTADVTVNHNLETNLLLLSLNPSIAYEFPFQLKLMVGLDMGYIFGSSYTQSEELVEPENFVFVPEESLVRNVVDNEAIQEINSLQLGLSLGAAYNIEISEDTYISPELTYIRRFTDVTSVDWKLNELRVGISYLTPIRRKIEKEYRSDTTYSRDTTNIFVYEIKGDKVKLSSKDETKSIVQDTPQLYAEEIVVNETYINQELKNSDITLSVEAFGLEADGSKTKYPKIIIEETEKEEAFPVLPFVFFERNTSNFRDTKFLTNLDGFIEDSLKPNVYEIYRNNLNIIANRLKTSNSKINLVAVNHKKNEPATEKVIDERLKNIEDYLKKLGIAESQINTESKQIEISSDGQDLADLIQEANRIEIQTKDNDLIRPVFINQIERSANPPAIELRIKANADAGIDNWNLGISQEGNQLRKYNGKSESEILKWEIIKEPSPRLEKPITVNLEATDKIGNFNSDEDQIQLNQLTLRKKRYELEDDKRIQKYSLIVFDYDSAELKAIHQKIIEEIKLRIEENSTIKIYGYADRVGVDDYNLKLSERRTENVRKQFESLSNKISVRAFGSNKEIYNNDLPEGRSLSRTVQIIIETPFEK